MEKHAVDMGRMNRLKVVREVDFGVYLDGGDPEEGGRGEILLPARYVPDGTEPGDEIEVFIYRDSEDRIIATTERPYVMLGDFGFLECSAVTKAGAFLDWGLPKDLLVPFGEMRERMQVGRRYVVGVYLDEETDRIVASARLDALLYDESEDDFEEGEEVDLFVAGKSELGYKVIVNTSHWGVLHHHEVVRPLRRGERLSGYIKHIRDDGRIDIALHRRARDRTDEAAEAILRALRDAGGFLAVGDKSPPERIRELFDLSKAMFKKALGSLYKRRMIAIEQDGIRLSGARESKRR